MQAAVRFAGTYSPDCLPRVGAGSMPRSFEDALNPRASKLQAQAVEGAAKTRVAPRRVVARHGHSPGPATV
jgi:hypothetical protein